MKSGECLLNNPCSPNPCRSDERCFPRRQTCLSADAGDCKQYECGKYCISGLQGLVPWCHKLVPIRFIKEGATLHNSIGLYDPCCKIGFYKYFMYCEGEMYACAELHVEVTVSERLCGMREI
jgi:hypothetical protein